MIFRVMPHKGTARRRVRVGLNPGKADHTNLGINNGNLIKFSRESC